MVEFLAGLCLWLSGVSIGSVLGWGLRILQEPIQRHPGAGEDTEATRANLEHQWQRGAK